MSLTAPATTTTEGPQSFPSITSPMPTIFTPPSNCVSHWTYEPQSANSVSGGLLMQNAVYEQQDKTCYPDGFFAWGRAPSVSFRFSPGYCPHDYTAAQTAVRDGTTTEVCCMSNFGYYTTVSLVNGGSRTAVYFGCTSIYGANQEPTTVAAAVPSDDGSLGVLDGTTTFTTEVAGPITMWGQPITVEFQSKDLARFGFSSTSASTSKATITPAPSTTGISTTSTTSAVIAGATQTSEVPQPSSNNLALSGGAIAGIAVGAAAVLGIIIGLATFFRRDGRRHKASPDPQHHHPTNKPPPEHHHHPPQAPPYYYEPEHKVNVQEVPIAQSGYGELAVEERRYELAGSNRF